MVSTRDLLKTLEDFDRTPESKGYDLRLDLADIVLKHLRDNGWTQKQLADAAKMKESFITRIIHAKSNCTFDVAGRLLSAIGADAELLEKPVDPANYRSLRSGSSDSIMLRTRGTTDGQEIPEYKSIASSGSRIGARAAASSAQASDGGSYLQIGSEVG